MNAGCGRDHLWWGRRSPPLCGALWIVNDLIGRADQRELRSHCDSLRTLLREDARVSDAGKGLALVAWEVKALATRVAREIAQHIGHIRGATGGVGRRGRADHRPDRRQYRG